MNYYETYQNQQFKEEFFGNALPGIWLGMMIALSIIFIFLLIVIVKSKHKDDKKKLITDTVKIIEKLPPKKRTLTLGDWYIVETAQGDRFKLRNIDTKNLFISVGDCGNISYKGETIISFKNKSM